MASISKYPPISTWETLLQRPTQSEQMLAQDYGYFFRNHN